MEMLENFYTMEMWYHWICITQSLDYVYNSYSQVFDICVYNLCFVAVFVPKRRTFQELSVQHNYYTEKLIKFTFYVKWSTKEFKSRAVDLALKQKELNTNLFPLPPFQQPFLSSSQNNTPRALYFDSHSGLYQTHFDKALWTKKNMKFMRHEQYFYKNLNYFFSKFNKAENQHFEGFHFLNCQISN